MKLTLKRRYLPNITIGRLFEEKKQFPFCYMIEPPDRDNQKDNSSTAENESGCIPEGEYKVEWTYSGRFKRNMFLVRDVEGRCGIRIHTANVVDELTGCIAPVSDIKSNVRHTDGKVYEHYGTASRTAMNKLEELILDKNKLTEFTLNIVSETEAKSCSVEGITLYMQ